MILILLRARYSTTGPKSSVQKIEVPDESALLWDGGQGCLSIRDRQGNITAAFRGLNTFWVEGSVIPQDEKDEVKA